MSRVKKNRKGGPLAATKKDRQDSKNKIQLGKAKGKGQKAGNKQQVALQAEQQKSKEAAKDKRLGSKKPIALTHAPVKKEQVTPKAAVWPPKTEAEQKAALQKLENDTSFMAQLDVLEEGGIIPADEQETFEAKLQQFDWLIEALGLAEDEEDDEWDDLSQQGKSLKDEWL